ncbi:hypothetical protein [Saccharibacillus alkalitolerans]|uniref:Uncharacterized protein n=1 Tax=Saccharibacillus alkalitolerans TaxID=2705290 RepID=A0ABX0F0F7_9BACL|nr:hypothetical protein [Saccharibacillus alkalitolerans]NGZ74481.1 hypothetical protein [Saccharibacillus alkalitolerans]
MADLMIVSFIVCAVTGMLGSAALFRRNKKQTRLYFGIALLSLLLVAVAMIALARSGAA